MSPHLRYCRGAGGLAVLGHRLLQSGVGSPFPEEGFLKMGRKGDTGPPLARQRSEDTTKLLGQNAAPLMAAPVTTTWLKLDRILGARPDTKHDLSTRVDSAAVELGLVCADQRKLAEWV
ncbi:hypothetical protein NDU88_000414 [Pleurodeles waltl]|uniref:Uncharacterized protein n=1 Tax=Pleurodeles waltl TaxID=8319 RepID=A0AAV7WLB6_PLEWA|nr:hypothetical protein NDU88_000414 [Pleurodeles waltl]